MFETKLGHLITCFTLTRLLMLYWTEFMMNVSVSSCLSHTISRLHDDIILQKPDLGIDHTTYANIGHRTRFSGIIQDHIPTIVYIRVTRVTERWKNLQDNRAWVGIWPRTDVFPVGADSSTAVVLQHLSLWCIPAEKQTVEKCGGGVAISLMAGRPRRRAPRTPQTDRRHSALWHDIASRKISLSPFTIPRWTPCECDANARPCTNRGAAS